MAFLRRLLEGINGRLHLLLHRFSSKKRENASVLGLNEMSYLLHVTAEWALKRKSIKNQFLS
jgi:hypothetical protein